MKLAGILWCLILCMACEGSQIQKRDLSPIGYHPCPKEKQSVVFIAGFDQGDNTYYANARSYFKAQGVRVIDTLFSLQEILLWLKQHYDDKVYDKIHIVSHSNAWRGMSLKTTPSGSRITLNSLKEALKAGEIPKLHKGIGKESKIIFHSCGLGENQELLQALKAAFTAEAPPQIYASVYFNVFGGKFAAHYLAKPYYGYYPTGESPGPLALAKNFEAAYGTTHIDWLSALRRRREGQQGMVYTYKFNIPVDWEFYFEDVSDIPVFRNREDIMDWLMTNDAMAEVLFQMGIPLEKYRWKSAVNKNTLTIKGKTTVLCVLEPILSENDANEYRFPEIRDQKLYQIL
ncbi:hypothetical protein [Spongiimicrobium salis]|uniref:hypothetical protein n=1 Tax=Spongiimicrobium salis TaxID=1667022 RepID=UPI00374CACFD